MLNTNMADEGEDLREHIVNKYGPRGARMVDDPNNHLMQSGRQVGIAFTNKRRIYPTIKVSQVMSVVSLCQEKKKQMAFAESRLVYSLFTHYHVNLFFNFSGPRTHGIPQRNGQQ